ncbi:hypothetical protein [Demequina oxidasica]|uniref:hypothetical protein n=1 Tax=Demequina oxidasica TaxID=676199 RepID=UPI0007815F9A|nr:hypothetical protein [Demequina oxidasica]
MTATADKARATVLALAQASAKLATAERHGDGPAVAAAEEHVVALRHEINAQVLTKEILYRIDRGGLAAADLPALMTLLASAVTE